MLLYGLQSKTAWKGSWLLCDVCFQHSLMSNSDLRAVYIPFLLLNSTFTVIPKFFFLNIPIFRKFTGNSSSCKLYWLSYLFGFDMCWRSLAISFWFDTAITTHSKRCSSLFFWINHGFLQAIYLGNLAWKLPLVKAYLWKLMCKCTWPNVKLLSSIWGLSTCVLIFPNIHCNNPSISLPSKSCIIKLINDISILMYLCSCGVIQSFSLCSFSSFVPIHYQIWLAYCFWLLRKLCLLYSWLVLVCQAFMPTIKLVIYHRSALCTLLISLDSSFSRSSVSRSIAKFGFNFFHLTHNVMIILVESSFFSYSSVRVLT